MRGFVRTALIGLLGGAFLAGGVALAQDGAVPLIPQKRLVLSQDLDLPGGDVASFFDTNIDACERACLTDSRCTALTFNTKNGSCFIKSNPGEGTPFVGAYSADVLLADPAAEALAKTRRAELGFLPDWDITSAPSLAEGMANEHVTNGWTAEEHMTSAEMAEADGNYEAAWRFIGAALNRSDSADHWLEYARVMLLAADRDSNNAGFLRNRAVWATVNAYLRADNKAFQHNILLTMAQAFESVGRGRDMVPALRLAQDLQPRDDTAAALDDAIGKYGFRIADDEVQADSLRPRICANFTEDLVRSGVDYSTFVQLPAPDLSVTTDGYRQICVEGVEPGARYTVTFREGLPAADGQTMAKSVAITAYVRDRNPGVRFPGRGYVLPATGGASIPVETVNTDKLNLTLYRVTDRNLLRSLQNGYFGQPMAEYDEYDFTDEVGAEIWTGTATVGQEINRDVTTRLPLDEAIAGQPAGIYALRAAVPGVDIWEIPAGWQWFVVSDLGLTTMSGVDGLHVFVRSLGTAAAKEGISVELLSVSNEIIATLQTDAQGYAMFEPGLMRGKGGNAPSLVVAREGEADVGFLSLTDPEFDLSDRGVEGREPAPPVDVFLATDRGAYRAGETIYATALSRDPQAEAVTPLPLLAVLYRPDGVEYLRAMADDGGAGGHVFALPVGATAPRGVWRMEVMAEADGDVLANQTVLVEDFLPERIDFDLTLPEGDLRLGDIPALNVDAVYLFGAPGADLAVEGEVRLSAVSGLEAWPGYVFGRYDQPFSASLSSFSGYRTDDAGNAVIDAEMPMVDDPMRPLEARFTVRVAEGSGRPVERRMTKLLAPSAPIIGVKPMFDDVVPDGSEARFSLIGIGPDTQATPMQVRWKVTRIETDYQWYQTSGNWYWEPITRRTPVTEGTADLGTVATEITAAVEWGEYELSVERTDGALAATAVSFYAGWYAPADVSSTPDTLELSLDKDAYKPGETAMLRIVPRAAGTALVTVLSNRLVAMQAVEVKEGENLIPLTVTDEWGAGVYVTASVIRPMDVAAGRNPARALGLSYASIDPGARALSASIVAPAEAAPRGPLEVAVKVDGVEPGDMAYATIAAVDVGILNLTGFEPPDPQDHYFGQRKLGVGLRDIYGRLIDGMNGAEGQVRSGGDAGAQARLQSPPPTEELVAYFSGPVQVGEDGMARASFDLPSFNGTVKVMAIVWSKKGVGQANADVLVRDPVVVTASLPRFMSPGDESRVLLEIVHATGPTGRMSLDVSGSAGVTLGAVPSGFDLGDKAKAVFAVPVTALEVGVQNLTVSLTTPDGKVLKKVLNLPVQVNDPEVVRVSRLDLAQGQSFTFDENVFAGLIPGSGTATLAVGPIARLNAPGLLASLDRYPYGCTEQITSKALPLLYFNAVAEAMDLEGSETVTMRVQQAIEEVLTNQSAEGAFGLWGAYSGDFWLDAFVTDFLSRARAQGFTVPDLAFRQALDNLRNQVNYHPDFDMGGEALAYALMVLAREGAAAVGDLRYYADVKGDAFATPAAMAQLGAALASYGDQPRADAMFGRAAGALNALAAKEAAQIYRVDYGTYYRDTAAVLTLAVEAGSQVVDREALTTRLAVTGTLSTQEATWALLAANALIDGSSGAGITLNGAPTDGPLVKVLDRTNLTPVVVANDGVDTTLTVTTYGVPSEPEPAGGNGYAITRTYYTLDGEAASLDGLSVGDRLVTVLEVTPFGSGEARLMVADPLPAGFEIDNPNLITGGSLENLDWLQLESEVTHSEFRQDRFLTAIDRYGNQAFRLAYIVRAVSPGVFHHPAASVEDMYRPDYKARSETGSLTISE